MSEQSEQTDDRPDDQPEMPKPDVELTIRRILVALDTSTHSMAALNAAANMASTLHAELIGLFVEDINLLHLAGLPFSTEVTRPTASGRALDQTRMERELRLQASQARRALAQAAEQAETEWTFRVVRGVVAREVLAAALEADLLTLGRASRPLTQRVRLGSTARAAVAEASRPVLLGQRGTDIQQPVIVTYDGSPAGKKALAAALSMAQANSNNLVVLIVAKDAASAPDLAEQAARQVEERGVHIHTSYHHVPPENGDNLLAAIRREKCSIVVLGGESYLLRGEALQRLLDDLNCLVMLVR